MTSIAARAAAGLSEKFSAWRERWRMARELTELDRQGSLEGVLADMGLNRSHLARLLSAPAGATKRLEAMARRVGANLMRLSSRERNETYWRCIACERGAECRRWLASGYTDGYVYFCPNADTLRQLREGGAASDR